MDKTESTIALIAFAAFILSTIVEWFYWRRKGERKYYWPDTLANYALVFMQIIFDTIGKALFVIFSLEWIRRHGLQFVTDERQSQWWAIAICFLGVDVGFYWFHRASHRIRFLWAIHVTHHSSELMNFSTALRQPVLEHLLDWMFFIPLALIASRPMLGTPSAATSVAELPRRDASTASRSFCTLRGRVAAGVHSRSQANGWHRDR